jgi:hypothetical protein
MLMHGMCFPFVEMQVGGRREPNIPARLEFAVVEAQVGVYKLTARWVNDIFKKPILLN